MLNALLVLCVLQLAAIVLLFFRTAHLAALLKQERDTNLYYALAHDLGEVRRFAVSSAVETSTMLRSHAEYIGHILTETGIPSPLDQTQVH